MCVCTYMSACVGIYMCGCVLVCIFLYVCTYNVVNPLVVEWYGTHNTVAHTTHSDIRTHTQKDTYCSVHLPVSLKYTITH